MNDSSSNYQDGLRAALTQLEQSLLEAKTAGHPLTPLEVRHNLWAMLDLLPSGPEHYQAPVSTGVENPVESPVYAGPLPAPADLYPKHMADRTPGYIDLHPSLVDTVERELVAEFGEARPAAAAQTPGLALLVYGSANWDVLPAIDAYLVRWYMQHGPINGGVELLTVNGKLGKRAAQFWDEVYHFPVQLIPSSIERPIVPWREMLYGHRATHALLFVRDNDELAPLLVLDLKAAGVTFTLVQVVDAGLEGPADEPA